MAEPTATSPESWLQLVESACLLLDDVERKGFGKPQFSLGGGTVLMLRFQHRLSKDIDLFGYDVQWLSILSPRLNDTAACLASDYSEQANSLKIVMANGDVDFIIAADIARPVDRVVERFVGRDLLVDPVTEILAKKLFYRAAYFLPRDVYDMSAAIDLEPQSAARAVKAARSKRDVLIRRLDHLEGVGDASLREGLVPYEGTLRHAAGMVAKMKEFLISHIDDPGPGKEDSMGRRRPESRKIVDRGRGPAQ